jgi:translocation and assembly module TamA
MWEHRNLLGAGERVSFAGRVSEVTYEQDTSFARPAFLHPSQTLVLRYRIANDDPPAYLSRSAWTRADLERRFTGRFQAGVGVSYKVANVEQVGRTRQYGIVALPVAADWNAGDDPLNPTRGGRVIGELRPTVNTRDDSLAYTRAVLDLRGYLPIGRRSPLVLAARVSTGVIAGETRNAIPADERFYAGGGGSIRGYEYQSVGELAEDGTPLGGNSLLEMSAEARVRATQSLGLVLFADGGSAFTDTVPSGDQKARWSAGAGIRYTTPVGPIRVDVALPLDRREGFDEPYQFYISLGQAF